MSSESKEDAVFKALANGKRRQMLDAIKHAPLTTGALCVRFPEMDRCTVMQHLKVLEGAGLISRGRNAQLRPCRLEAQPLREAVGWIEEFAKHWDTSLNRLDGLLERLQSTDAAGKKN